MIHLTNVSAQILSSYNKYNLQYVFSDNYGNILLIDKDTSLPHCA